MNSKRYRVVVFLIFLMGTGAYSADPVRLYPGDDIQSKLDVWPENTTFQLAPGLYRLQRVVPKSGDSFIGQDRARMSGAIELTDWHSETININTDEDVEKTINVWRHTLKTVRIPGLLTGECNELIIVPKEVATVTKTQSIRSAYGRRHSTVVSRAATTNFIG